MQVAKNTIKNSTMELKQLDIELTNGFNKLRVMISYGMAPIKIDFTEEWQKMAQTSSIKRRMTK